MIKFPFEYFRELHKIELYTIFTVQILLGQKNPPTAEKKTGGKFGFQNNLKVVTLKCATNSKSIR